MPILSEAMTVTVSIPRIVLEHQGSFIDIEARKLHLSRPNDVLVLQHALLNSNRELLLYHLSVRDLDVIDVATSRSMVDCYRVSDDNSSILGLAGITATRVRIMYRAAQTRYDLLVFDPLKRVAHIVPGEERGADVAEYRPPPPAGMIPLAYIHVSATAPADVVVVSDYVDQVRVGFQAQHRSSLLLNQSRLPNLRRLMCEGKPVRLCGYGTSLTAQGGPGPDYYLIPNGPARDFPKYFSPSRFPPDSLARVDLVNGPGAEKHTRTGWNWAFKAAIERGSTSEVTYLNMGNGGTTAGSDERNARLHGSHPKRLAAARALDADVVVIEFGTNDFKNPDFYSDLRRIIDALRSPKTDIVLMGVPGTPQAQKFRHWLRVEQEVALAAERAAVAFVPLAPLVHPNNLGAIGLAWRTLCSTNANNHPGLVELAAYGRELARLAEGLIDTPAESEQGR